MLISDTYTTGATLWYDLNTYTTGATLWYDLNTYLPRE